MLGAAAAAAAAAAVAAVVVVGVVVGLVRVVVGWREVVAGVMGVGCLIGSGNARRQSPFITNHRQPSRLLAYYDTRLLARTRAHSLVS